MGIYLDDGYGFVKPNLSAGMENICYSFIFGVLWEDVDFAYSGVVGSLCGFGLHLSGILRLWDSSYHDNLCEQTGSVDQGLFSI